MADEKQCTRCGIPKPIGEFRRKHTARDGRQASCRSCNGYAGLGKGRKLGGAHPWRSSYSAKGKATIARLNAQREEAA